MLSFRQFADMVDAGLRRRAPGRGIYDIERFDGDSATWKRNNATARIASLSDERMQPLSLFFYVGSDVVPSVVRLTQTEASAEEAATRIVGHLASWGEPAAGE